MKTLRRILNNTRIDKIRNERIRETCEIQNITSWAQRRRMEWSLHIARMAEDRLVRKVHDGMPVGKRNQGLPKKRWRDRSSGCREMEIHTCVNRSSGYREMERHTGVNRSSGCREMERHTGVNRSSTYKKRRRRL
jgi:hypothetical protein